MKMIWLFPTSFSLSDEPGGRKVTAHESSRRARSERRRPRRGRGTRHAAGPPAANRRAGSRTPSPPGRGGRGEGTLQSGFA